MYIILSYVIKYLICKSVTSKSLIIILFNIFFVGIGIVINVAGCLIRGRRRWSVTYTSPRGLHISEFGIEGHFRRENLTSFLVG